LKKNHLTDGCKYIAVFVASLCAVASVVILGLVIYVVCANLTGTDLAGLIVTPTPIPTPTPSLGPEVEQAFYIGVYSACMHAIEDQVACLAVMNDAMNQDWYRVPPPGHEPIPQFRHSTPVPYEGGI
jgi:hypothetical protein